MVALTRGTIEEVAVVDSVANQVSADHLEISTVQEKCSVQSVPSVATVVRFLFAHLVINQFYVMTVSVVQKVSVATTSHSKQDVVATVQKGTREVKLSQTLESLSYNLQ